MNQNANNFDKQKLKAKFINYWNTYINTIIRRKIETVISEHQKEIKVFRIKWGIDRYKFENQKINKDWLKLQLTKYKTGLQIVYESHGEVKIPTEKFIIEIPGKIKLKKRQILNEKLGKEYFYYFRQRILELAYEIGIDAYWVNPFENYIFTNIIDMGTLVNSPIEITEKIYYSHQQKEIGKKACLTFGPNTRLKDISLIWKWQIKPLLETLPGYREKWPRNKKKDNRNLTMLKNLSNQKDTTTPL